MINIKKILKRSWHILWSYRMLWVFGFILALTLGGNNINLGSNSNVNRDQRSPVTQFGPAGGWQGLKGDTFPEKMNDAFQQMGAAIQRLQVQHPVEFQMGISVAIMVLVVILLLAVLSAVLRFVALTASIRMVDEYEQSGVKVGFRQGWKYGWSLSAWRLFLVNLVVGLPGLVLFVVLGLVAWWIVSAFLSGVQTAIISSLIAGIGLAFLFIFVTVILMVVLFVVRDFAWRMIVLEGAGPLEALRKAMALVRRQWKNVGLMWLVMIGLNLVWGIAFLILVFPLLIVSIITALGGVLAAIVPSLLTAGFASLLSAPGYWPWIFAAIIGLPFFLVVTFSPILLVSGWGHIFQSSTWTLTYRELKALETVAPEVAPN